MSHHSPHWKKSNQVQAKIWSYQFEKCHPVYPFNYCISIFLPFFNICFYISSSSVIPLIVYLWKSLPIFLLLPAHLLVLCTYCEFVPHSLPIFHSSFIAFPGKMSFQLCISACPQSASVQLWGGDGWRKLHVCSFSSHASCGFPCLVTGEVLCFPCAFRKLKGSNGVNEHRDPVLSVPLSQDGRCSWRWQAAAEGQRESGLPHSRELVHGQLLAGSLFL